MYKIIPILKPALETYQYAVTAIASWPLVSKEELLSIKAKIGNKEVERRLEAIISGQADLVKMLSDISQSLLGHAWEILLKNRHVTWDYNHPVIQFFRHIRNGCYHGNTFHFRGDEPMFRAEWRGRVIKRSLQGKKIFLESKQDEDFFLDWQEAILLLEDVSRILEKR